MEETARPRIPSATYRLQFHAGFTFRDARNILDYLDELGISDIYCSPYFQASPASTHGYDVANHNRLNPAIGDDSDFRSYISGLRERGLGQILDFVPNHMGIGESLNQWWMEVLEEGVASPYARYFDIDWHPGKEALSQRILLPILGERYGKVLENGEFKLRLENGAFFLCYHDTRLPLNPATYREIFRPAFPLLEGASLENLRKAAAAFEALPLSPEAKAKARGQLDDLIRRDPGVSGAIGKVLQAFEGDPAVAASFDLLHQLLERQVYRLSYWRIAAEEINYRRFFDINTLAAIRVEIPEVFEATHQFVFELLARGDVNGLRIDHIDGLWDPRAYLRRLQQRYAELCGPGGNGTPLYLVTEKILELTHERLPADWPVHGTTGYEFANQIVQFLVDSAAEKRLTRLYQRFTGVTESFADLVYEKKMLTMQISLGSEIASLGRMLDELSEMHRHYRDLTRNMLTTAVREVVACFPVYRTYITPEGASSPEDEKVILRAVSAARRRNPSIEKPVFDFLRNVLLLRLPERFTDDQKAAHAGFVMKFQQCTGPVMAKGLEDTALYIYHRLVALNEVGGNPGMFGLDRAAFHRLTAERLERSPHTLLGTSTHDTKRSEDVRLRIAALSEIPDVWQKAVKRWAKWNKKHRSRVGDRKAPSPNEEYLLYQTLLGTWQPLDDETRRDYVTRIQQYLTKALKEAKVNSSWTEPDEEWEQAASAFVERILDKTNGEFLGDLEALAGKVAKLGAMNSLAQVILKCTLPGVPDFYQGTEIWNLSLVDPDNRRPVDYAARRSLLASLAGQPPPQLLEDWQTGGIKLFLIQKLLRLRKEQAGFFRNADYQPIETGGSFRDHLLAFQRSWQGKALFVAVPRCTAKLGTFPTGAVWKDTMVDLPGADWQDIFTGAGVSGADKRAAALFAQLPFAVYFRTA